MITYPDCEACNCSEINMPPAESETLDDLNVALANNNDSILADFVSIGAYDPPINCFGSSQLPNGSTIPDAGTNSEICQHCYNNNSHPDTLAGANYNTVLFSGYDPDAEITGDGAGSLTQPSNKWYKSPFAVVDSNITSPYQRTAYHVTLPQAVNLMNQRERYFEQIEDVNNPGNFINNTTPNRMLVDLINDQFASNGVVPPPPSPGVNRYEDMPLIMVTDSQVNMDNGQLLSFVDPELVPDENVNNTGLTINQYGYQSIEGTMTYNPSNYVQVPSAIEYIDPNGNTQNVDMDFYSPVSGLSYNFKTGLEYHQVIGSMTIGEAFDIMTGNSNNTIYINQSILWNYMIGKVNQLPCGKPIPAPLGGKQVIQSLSWTEYFSEYKSLKIYFMAKGVDPFAPRQKMKFNMSMLFGASSYSDSSTYSQTVFEGDYFPNIPISESSGDQYTPESHYDDLTSNLRFDNNGIGNSNSNLFYKSFLFTPPLPQPQGEVSGFTIGFNLPYVTGDEVKLSLDDSNYIIATVNSYDPANGNIELTFNSSIYTPGTSGGFGSWCITLINSFTPFETTAFAYYSSLGIQWGNNLDTNNTSGNGDMGSSDGKTVKSTNSSNGTIIPFVPPGPWAPDLPPAQGSNVQPNFVYSISNTNATKNGQGRIDGASYQWTNKSPNSVLNVNTDRGYTIAPSYWLDEDPLVPNSNTPTIEMNDRTQLIFRSDRLPTSSYRDTGLDATLRTYQDFPFMLNETFSLWMVGDSGQSTLVGGTGGGTVSNDSSGGLGDLEGDPDSSGLPDVLETFTCNGLVVLRCYQGEGDDFEVNPDCSEFDRIQGGCYVFVDNPLIISLFGKKGDFAYLLEWRTRIKFMFAACRGVIAHSFQNNWINGTLYMPSFQKRTFYNSDNEVKRYKYCGDPQSGEGGLLESDKKNCGPLYFNTDSNSFFYRSAPYYDSKFIPSKKCNYGFFGGLATIGANDGNIFQPTTIMDLGPKTDFLKEILLTPEFQGYIVDEIETTSYQDVSGLLNLFIISRLISTSFIDKILGAEDASVQTLFSRDGGVINRFTDSRIDGDYAQMISINTEFGVLPYLSGNYEDSISVNDSLMGVWFTGNTKSIYNTIGSTVEDRRVLGPGRLTFNELDSLGGADLRTSDFKYPGSQIIPHYGWKYDNGSSVWGTEKNTWQTVNAITAKYQDEEFEGTNNYPRPQDGLGTGFLFNRTLGIFSGTPPPDGDSGDGYRVGSPFQNYFGLKKGKSAMNLFITKYMFNADLNG
jgi:hypothetical protein